MRRRFVLHSTIALIWSTTFSTGQAFAFPGFGDMINDFCTAEERIPPAPFDGNCTFCHISGTSADSSNRVQPDWDEFENARRGRNGVAQGDFSFFCAMGANQAPVIDPIPDLMSNLGQPFSISIMATDPDMDAIQLSVSSVDATGFDFVDLGTGEGELTWTPAAVGNFSFRASATDQMRTSFQDFVVSVGSVNLPPVLNPIGDRLATSGVPLRFLITATEDDGDNLTFEMSGAPTTANIALVDPLTAEFSWTPGAGDTGNLAVLFTVTDDGVPPESDSEEITISVGGANRPPTLGAIGNRNVKVGETLRFPLTATDPEDDALTFSATGLPPNATLTELSSGAIEFSWTPTVDQIGSHDVDFEVTDSGVPPESDLEMVTILVTDGVVEPPSTTPQVRRAVWREPKGKRREQARLDEDSDSADSDGDSDSDEDSDSSGSQEGVTRASQGGELRVHGRRAPAGALVGIWDADRGERLGETLADDEGRFRYKTRSLGTPPCRIEAEVGGLHGVAVDVLGAGRGCGP